MFPDETERGHKKPPSHIEKREDTHRHDHQERRHPGRDHAYDEKPKKSEDRPQRKDD